MTSPPSSTVPLPVQPVLPSCPTAPGSGHRSLFHHSWCCSPAPWNHSWQSRCPWQSCCQGPSCRANIIHRCHCPAAPLFTVSPTGVSPTVCPLQECPPQQCPPQCVPYRCIPHRCIPHRCGTALPRRCSLQVPFPTVPFPGSSIPHSAAASR